MGTRNMTTAGEKKSEHAEAQKSDDSKNLFWQDEVLRARKRHIDWRRRADDVIDVYRGITDKPLECFNILWSNTETLKGAVYSHTPRPEVTRKFLEIDIPGNAMATVVERCIAYCQDLRGHEFDPALENARDDYLLTGRGTVRVCYEAEFEDEEAPGTEDIDLETGEQVTLAAEPIEKKSYEEVYLEYVPWDKFEHSFGETWEEVWWVAFAKDMTRDELIEKFGEAVGSKVPLNGVMKSEDWENWETHDAAGFYAWYDREDYARVWEVWDKRTGKVLYIAEAAPDLISEDEDPLHLEGFFPCPRPIYSIKTSGSLEPIPEYTQYQYQAEELNIVTRRLTRLTDGLKARGVCDADIHSLTRLFDGEDNAIIPDEDYGKLAAQGGVEGAISWAPIAVIADVIVKLSQRRQELLGEIYELTGISDILRGDSDPRETATAVRTKGRFGTLRLQMRQKEIQRFARDAVRLMADVIAEFFSVETLILMSGVENRPDIMAGMEQMVTKLRDDELRDYTITIETDSTIAINEFEQKQDVTEFFQATSTLLQHLMPAVQQGVLPMQVAKSMLTYAASRFNAGRDLLGALETIGSQPPAQKEDPQVQAQMQAQQMQQQIEQAKLELAKVDLQLKQAELQFKQQKMMVDAQIEQEKLKLEYTKLGIDWEGKKLTEQVKLATAKMDVDAAKANRPSGSN